MAKDQKKTEIPFKNCCQGMPIREMTSKMIEKKSESPFGCAEMKSRIVNSAETLYFSSLFSERQWV